MRSQAVFLSLVLAVALFAAGKPAPKGVAEDEAVRLEASVYPSKEAVKELIGNDLGGFYVVLKVTATPKSKLKLDGDDFLLRTDRDGEKAHPYSATQIAGSGTLVISQTYEGGGIASEETGPVWGGVGGPMGRFPTGGGFGNSGSVESNQTTVGTGDKKESPLVAQLRKVGLPEGEFDQPVSGLLFFPMEPKQKVKQLELIYTSPKGKLSLRFK